MTGGSRPEVRRLADLRSDLAARHRQPVREHPADPAAVDAACALLRRDGYVVLEGLLDPAVLQSVRDAVEPLLGAAGRNAFEGHRTQRAYSLLARTRAVDGLVEHPLVLAVLDRVFDQGCLLSQLQAIGILPDETAQLLHHDDGFYPWPRPRPPLGAATVWALDEFTAENGATVLLPGSHRWPEGRVPQPSDERRTAVMPAGSVVLFLGTTWHGGGANRSSARRLAITAQYCEPWLRPQESFLLSVDRETARQVSPALRSLIGYSIHPPFMGMVDGMHPLRVLDRP